MPEYPNRHPGAPLTLWMRPRPDWRGGWYQGLPDAPDAVEYIRKDAADAMLTEASQMVTPWPPLKRAPE